MYLEEYTGREVCWHIGEKFPQLDVVGIQADGDELQLILRLLPTVNSGKLVQAFNGSEAEVIYSTLRDFYESV
jgi:hypothetical protein